MGGGPLSGGSHLPRGALAGRGGTQTHTPSPRHRRARMGMCMHNQLPTRPDPTRRAALLLGRVAPRCSPLAARLLLSVHLVTSAVPPMNERAPPTM